MKKLMSVLLALVLVLAMVPVAASAESTELPTPVDGVITLTENVELSSSYEVTGSLTLDLNGFTISNSGDLVSNADALAYLFRIDEGASLTCGIAPLVGLVRFLWTTLEAF